MPINNGSYSQFSAYIGRFAPSPSGLLHLGSLYTALASYLIAKSQQGKWLIRIEDIDPPREVAGASEGIIASLHAHGLIADADPSFQSHHSHFYQQAITQLQTSNLVYACACNRKRLIEFKGLYDRFCLNPQHRVLAHQACALRFKAPDVLPSFSDTIQGLQTTQAPPAERYNDFIIKRKDGLWAYQLAMVVDDIRAGVTEVVRGIDLLDNTAKQLALYQALQATAPTHIHIPVLSTSPGMKLSKQNHAKPIDHFYATKNLIICLNLLGQILPDQSSKLSPQQLINYAVKHFQLDKIPQCTELII